MSKRFMFEALLYAVVVVGTVVCMRMLDAFDSLYVFSRAHESWELDEFFAAVPGILVVMLFYSVRRSMELRTEIASRKEAEAQLRNELEMRKKFLTLVSHEMRTPVNGVIGILDGMQYFESEQEREMMREQAAKTAHGLARQLDDVIAFARIEQGELYIDEEIFDPGTVVKDIVEIVSFKAKTLEVHLSHTIAPDMPRQAQGFRGHLTQVLINLADNAVKFSEKGTVNINLAFEADKHDGNRGTLVYTVADNGKGIANEHLDHIFELFFQEDHEGARRYPGLGIGLSLVRQLVPLMGGTIEVESELGRGTTFVLRIPVGVQDT